ncbi:zf-HC2 domain-containing protein [Paenibacillus sp. GSMTC-2017]|uniref:zf-HC2 domain-containing protein n=1 Tax=Paenibacillus sp. GSMTC-2017 TaxID=2794350 RepID=UPI0018D9FB2E|nr:zf-HC2 domain-containing protein [Paenibacillus sp. GSMTC-2017]MBH5319400.1 zf-HC2 domain-containing protein [Paenibacillus sp. GSMTC-2017]
MNEIKCEIINDLLPLYIDNVCSEESRQLVEEHFDSCSNCKYRAEKLQHNIAIPRVSVENNNSEVKVLRGMSDFWNRTKIKAFMKGLIIASLSCTILLFAYIGLFHWKIVPVSMDVVEIKEVSQLANGLITYHVRLTDGYELNYTKGDLDKDGNMYVTPYRPIIKRKAKVEFGLHNMYYLSDPAESDIWQANWGDNIKMKALYFGTKEDNILIWKDGMKLPAASAQVEANFNWGN